MVVYHNDLQKQFPKFGQNVNGDYSSLPKQKNFKDSNQSFA